MAGKTFSDIYTQSSRDTGDTTASKINDIKIKVNDALREICGMMNFSWLKREVAFPIVAGTQKYTISAFASDWDEDTPIQMFYRGSSQQRIELECFDDSEWQNEEDLNEGDAYGFNVSKKSGSWKIGLTQVPSSAFVTQYGSDMKMEYQKYPTELSAAGDIPEIPTSQHQGLLYLTNSLVCEAQGDTEAAERWRGRAERSLGLLKKKQIFRKGGTKKVYPSAGVTIRGRGRNRTDYNR